MKKIVSVLLCLVMAMSLCTVAFAAATDPTHEHWDYSSQWTYVDNGDGTHKQVCICNEVVNPAAACNWTFGGKPGDKCICGSVMPEPTPACDHSQNHWKYEKLTDTTHKVICADCNEVVTASTPCVFTDGKCICGNEEAKCDHVGVQKVVDNKDGKTHTVICPKCNEVLNTKAEHVYAEDGKCACGAEKPACDHMGNHWIYTPVTAITHSVTCADCNKVETASTECVFTDGKCICGNVEPSCDHMANNWTYTPVTATTHSVTCNVCKAVVTESTPCVFTDGKCICGNVEPDCDHMGNHWIYTPITKTTHSVTCADCNVVVTASTDCVFETGTCICGNHCPHSTYVYTDKGDGTHEGFCADCGKHIATEDGEHSDLYFVNNKNGRKGTHTAFCGKCGAEVYTENHNFKGNKCVDCGAKKSTSSAGGSSNTTTTDTTKSPKTGDMGVVLYAATALLSLSGTAVVIKKRKNDK